MLIVWFVHCAMSKLNQSKVMDSNFVNTSRQFQKKPSDSGSSSALTAASETSSNLVSPKIKNQQIALDLLSVPFNSIDKLGNLKKEIDNLKPNENVTTDVNEHNLKMQQIVEAAIGCVKYELKNNVTT